MPEGNPQSLGPGEGSAIVSNDALAGKTPSEKQRFWIDELEHRAYNYQRDWEMEGDSIVARYRDQRGYDTRGGWQTSWRLQTGQTVITKRYNILYANVEVLRPVLYARAPVPVVSRRYKDADPVARVAAIIMERALSFVIDAPGAVYTLNSAMNDAVKARCLPGRGTTWVRYEADIVKDTEVQSRVGVDPETGFDAIETEEIEIERKAGERICFENVNFRDFRHMPARSFEEVWARGWVARRLTMTREELVERFGPDKGDAVRLTLTIREGDTAPDVKDTKKHTHAEVWEIWNRPDKKVYWISKGYQSAPLDEQDDPLGLQRFFPMPMPLMATDTDDSCLPAPDFRMYRDQSQNLDRLTTKIWLMTTALRAAGLYAGDKHQELAQLFDGVDRNAMIPVQDWNAIQGRGGVAGLVQWVPVDLFMQTLQGLYQAQEDNKRQIYEISGISDIMRGVSDAQETLGAQQLKGQYASVRIQKAQQDTQDYSRQLLRIAGEIIAEHFDTETIAEMTNFANTETAKDSAMQGAFEQAIELLRSDRSRSFQIDIETESTQFADEQSERADMIEYVQAMTGLLSTIAPIMQQDPAFGPLGGQIISRAARLLPGGRDFEMTLDQTLNLLQQRAEAAQESQGPSPAEIAMQMQQQETALKAQEAQGKLQIEQQKLALEARDQDLEVAMNEQDNTTKLIEAIIRANQAQEADAVKAAANRADNLVKLGLKAADVNMAPGAQ